MANINRHSNKLLLAGRRLSVLLTGVEPGGGGVGLVDLHLDDEGLELELHDISMMKII